MASEIGYPSVIAGLPTDDILKVWDAIVKKAVDVFPVEARGAKSRRALAVGIRELTPGLRNSVRMAAATVGYTFPSIDFGSRCYTYLFDKIERPRKNRHMSSRQSRNKGKKEYAGGYVLKKVNLGISGSGFTEEGDEATILVCARKVDIIAPRYLNYILARMPQETNEWTELLLSETAHIG